MLRATYADCGEDILQLVDKRDEARIIHIDSDVLSASLFTVIILLSLVLTRWGWFAPWQAKVRSLRVLSGAAIGVLWVLAEIDDGARSLD